MPLQPGQIYTPANADEIRARYLEDYELEARANGIDNPPIAPGTDVHIRATASANAHMLYYASLRQRDAERRVLEADLAGLHEIRQELGLPEVNASSSSGNVSISVLGGGLVTIPDQTQGILPNGFRVAVDGNQVGKANGATIPVVSLDKGTGTNLAVNQKIRWVSPPLNLATEATVSTALTGGLDKEDESRLRSRILNRLRNNPQGGNWAEIIEWILDADASVQYAFVYPALGGPSTFRACIIRAFDVDDENSTYSFSRAPTAGQLNTALAAVTAKVPEHVKFDVVAPTEVPADAAVKVDLPSSTLGTDGWKNATVWPQLVAADNGRVTVTVATSATSITVSANTTVSPEASTTQIMWWAPTEQKFYTSTVTAVAGSAGAWELTLGTALTDASSTDVAVGDFISPAANNADNYTTSWRAVLAAHGPGECTQDDSRLPRASRHPSPREEVSSGGTFPTDLKAIEICEFQDGNDEITDLSWSYRAVTGTSVGAVLGISNPEILIPRHFGMYAL